VRDPDLTVKIGKLILKNPGDRFLRDIWVWSGIRGFLRPQSAGRTHPERNLFNPDGGESPASNI